MVFSCNIGQTPYVGRTPYVRFPCSLRNIHEKLRINQSVTEWFSCSKCVSKVILLYFLMIKFFPIFLSLLLRDNEEKLNNRRKTFAKTAVKSCPEIGILKIYVKPLKIP